MKERLNIIINSTFLYVIAFLATTIIHELSHALIGVLNGSNPILYHNYVEHTSLAHLSILQQVSISLAGPVSSLFQGLIIGGLYLKSKNQTPLRLFLLWFSVLGFTNFFGYLMTGPLFQIGDIGKVFLLLNVPFFIQLVFAILGAIMLLFMAYKLTTPFLQFSFMEKWLVDKYSRKNFSFGIIILPWVIGSIIVTFLYLPIIAIVSIIYPILSGMVFIFPWQNAQRVENILLSKNKRIGEPSIMIYLSLVVLIIVFKFILASGIQFYKG